MNLAQTHQIRRVRFALKCRDVAQAEIWRQGLKQWFNEDTERALSQELDLLVGPNETLRLDKLELQLKLTQLSQLDRHLSDTLVKELHEQVERVRQTRSTKPSRNAEVSETATLSTNADSDLAHLQHYLLHGDLLWSSEQFHTERLTQQWRQILKSNVSVVMSIIAQADLALIYQVLQRLWILTETSFFHQHIAVHLGVGDWSRLEAIVQAVLNVNTTSMVSSTASKNSILSAAVNTGTSIDAAQIQCLIYALALSKDTKAQQLMTQLHQWQSGDITSQQVKVIEQWLTSAAVQHFVAQASTSTSVALLDAFERLRNQTEGLLVKSESINFTETQSESINASETSKTIVDDVAVSVRSAGLVLLHPFLTAFFYTLGLWNKEDKRLDPTQLDRAARLLHYLATGQMKAQEFELGMIWFLLGQKPAGNYFMPEKTLAKTDQEEADALLSAVINHWAALKNTTIDGLRLSFLQRPGVIRRDPNSHDKAATLHVQSESFDVLLRYLPWSISVVKLPWMPEHLLTTW